MSQKNYTAFELASVIGAKIEGNGDVVLGSVSSIELALPGQLTFAGSDEYIRRLGDCRASAVLVPRKIEGIAMTQLVAADVDEALICALGAFAPLRAIAVGVHKTAFVSDSAVIGEGVSIGAFVFIDDDVTIGDNTVIDCGAVVKYGSKIGSSCRIDANVTIYHGCRIGNHCVVQAGSVIGGIGFGYRNVNNMPQLIPHYGGVVLEDFVEIGANSCVDRAKFGDTVIGMGTKIDNLVQIAHNCKIGKCCLFVGQSGIGGSSEMGNGAIIGGQSGLVDHRKIGDGVRVAAKSMVTNNIDAGSSVYGIPARDVKKVMRAAVETNRLPETVKRIKELEKKVANLEKANDN